MPGAESKSEFFRARVHNHDTIIAAAVAIERLGSALGLSSLEATRFRFAFQELCVGRISSGFDRGQAPEAKVVLETRPGAVAVVVYDSGSPIEASNISAGADGWLAQLTARGFADALHASFEGREGNRCEIVKNLRHPQVAHPQEVEASGLLTRAEVEADSVAPRRPNSSGDAIRYRNMAPDDALRVAQCFYRTYGFTGPMADEVAYHPDQFAELVRAGLHLGSVATLADGRIVGHIAVSRDRVEDPVGTSGYLVVDPDFRGHGIGDALSDLKIVRGREARMRGLLGMTVTVHTASQKTSLKEGGHEVGVLLAAQEDSIVMQGIAADARRERHPIIPFFTPLQSDIRRKSFPPPVHREIAAAIHAACGLDREVEAQPQRVSPDELPERSSLSVTVLGGARFAKIRVGTYGRDFLGEIFHLVENLHHHRVDVVRLEMLLGDPLTARFGYASEHLGFSFAAIFPATLTGDLLCLQSLDRVAVNPGSIHTASDHGAAVLAAVLESRDRVLSSTAFRTLEGARKVLTIDS